LFSHLRSDPIHRSQITQSLHDLNGNDLKVIFAGKKSPAMFQGCADVYPYSTECRATLLAIESIWPVDRAA
jgi:hypothetical protein